MTEYLNHFTNALNTKISHGIGIFAGAMAATTANVDIPINIMDLSFTIGNVYFTVQNCVTLAGAFVGLGILIISVIKLVAGHGRKDGN